VWKAVTLLTSCVEGESTFVQQFQGKTPVRESQNRIWKVHCSSFL
jgi:hypothetical protein